MTDLSEAETNQAPLPPDVFPPAGAQPHGRGDKLRAAGQNLAAMVPLVRLGSFLVGAAVLLGTARFAVLDRPAGLLIWLGALALAVACGLAGWAAGNLLKAASTLLDWFGDRADAVVPTTTISLGNLAEAFGPSSGEGHASEPDRRPRAQEDIRHAIAASDWLLADDLLRRFLDDHPDDAEGSRLSAELAEARGAALEDLQAKLAAARDVTDTERVLLLRDSLTALLAPDARRELDQELARWFMAVIQKRLRTGAMLAEVAVLASQVAERMDATTEGASLRAALPTLRRSGGLCARCGQPYNGIADACPKCLTTAPSVNWAMEADDPEPEPDDDTDSDPLSSWADDPV